MIKLQNPGIRLTLFLLCLVALFAISYFVGGRVVGL